MTPVSHGGIMGGMENQTPSIYTVKASRRTEVRGFRLYRDQSDWLKTNLVNSGESSKLIRILLDEYIAGRLPAVKLKMNQKVKI